MSITSAQTYNPLIVQKPAPVKFHGALYESIAHEFQGGDLASGSFTFVNITERDIWIQVLIICPDSGTTPTVAVTVAGTSLTKKQAGTNTGFGDNTGSVTLPASALNFSASYETQEICLPAQQKLVITQGGTGALHFFIQMAFGVNRIG